MEDYQEVEEWAEEQAWHFNVIHTMLYAIQIKSNQINKKKIKIIKLITV